jgi:hypothetical protein
VAQLGKLNLISPRHPPSSIDERLEKYPFHDSPQSDTFLHPAKSSWGIVLSRLGKGSRRVHVPPTTLSRPWLTGRSCDWSIRVTLDSVPPLFCSILAIPSQKEELQCTKMCQCTTLPPILSYPVLSYSTPSTFFNVSSSSSSSPVPPVPPSLFQSPSPPSFPLGILKCRRRSLLTFLLCAVAARCSPSSVHSSPVASPSRRADCTVTPYLKHHSIKVTFRVLDWYLSNLTQSHPTVFPVP